MAYEKQTWVNGDVITAEKLNHMEDGIAEGGDCDCGFECTETMQTLFNETVTTIEGEDDSSATLAYSQAITADTLIVTFDGVEYTCPANDAGVATVYGGYSPTGTDFSEFPFAIASIPNSVQLINRLFTETAGEHTVKVESTTKTVTTTPCFEQAVLQVAGGGDAGYECTETTDELFEETVTTSGSSPSPMAILASTERITANTLTITFDGVEYDCPKQEMSGTCLYGASSPNDFSTYPFAFMSSEENMLYTQTAGEHTIAASTTVYTPENVSDCFKGAVGGVVSDYLAKNFASHIHTETVQGEVSVRPDGVTGGVDLACPHKPVGIIGIQPTAKHTMGVDGEVILKEMYMAGSYDNNLHLDYLNTTSEVQTFTVYVTYTYIGAGRDR